MGSMDATSMSCGLALRLNDNVEVNPPYIGSFLSIMNVSLEKF